MGFKFNGVHSDTFGLKVKNYMKPILPPVSVSHYSVPNKAGGIINSYRLDPRDISIFTYFVETSDATFEDKVREIADWLYATVPKQLILDEEQDVYYNAILKGDTFLEQTLFIGNGDIVFTCHDPYAYEVTQDVTSWVTGNSTANVSNEGTETYPVISFTAWASSITISNITTGKELTLSGLTVGDVLSIDNSRGTVTKNGVATNINLTLESEFFPLIAGSNTLSCVDAVHNTITITYRKRYL